MDKDFQEFIDKMMKKNIIPIINPKKEDKILILSKEEM